MSKPKVYRKQLEGQRRALEEHLKKIAEEMKRPNPRRHLIGGWQKTVENIRKRIEILERRLKR